MYQLLSTFMWQDLIEIFFFATVWYQASRWLIHDKQQPLVGYLYGYALLTFGSYFAGLFTMSYVLCALAPVVAMVFVLIHQHTLQRNYITLQNITPHKQEQHHNWIELLVRSCLVAMNQNKPVQCIIEQKHSLHNFIWTPFVLDTFVQPGLIEMLLQTPSYDATSFLWLNHHGKLHAVACRWQDNNSSQDHNAHWQEDALLYTGKTDAIVLYANPTTHAFTILADNKLVEGISAPQAIRILTSYTHQEHKKGTPYHDQTSKNNTAGQSAS